jgi:hypothetical protein
MSEPTFYPGTKVLVFDSRLFVDDIRTPLKTTMQEATVLRWYGKRPGRMITGPPYDSLIDIRFHRDQRISRGHFTASAKVIE